MMMFLVNETCRITQSIRTCSERAGVEAITESGWVLLRKVSKRLAEGSLIDELSAAFSAKVKSPTSAQALLVEAGGRQCVHIFDHRRPGRLALL